MFRWTSSLALALSIATIALKCYQSVGKINPEYAALLDKCNDLDLSAVACKTMLAEAGVKVLIVHPRSIDDIFYNQVVVPVDYTGKVLGGSASGAFDGMVHYPFEWRSKPIWGYGNRTIGPWNCTNLRATDCCYRIESSVIDRDIHNKLIDCWLTEAKIKSDDGVVMQYFKDENGTIKYMTHEKLIEVEDQENRVRIKLMEDILHALDQEYMPKKTAWNFLGRIRQAVRDIERAQMYPYHIKNQIRQVWNQDFVPMNGVMTYMFRAVFKVLTQLWVAGGRENLRAHDGDLLILEADEVDWDIMDTVKFQNWLDSLNHGALNPNAA